MLITSPLAVSQQTRLVNYLDARFLDISRAFKKRYLLHTPPIYAT